MPSRPEKLGRDTSLRVAWVFAMIQARRLQPELMDQPDLDADQHVEALRGLQRINIVSRSAMILWPAIASVWKNSPTENCECSIWRAAAETMSRRSPAWPSVPTCRSRSRAATSAITLLATPGAARAAAGVEDVPFFRMNVLEEPLPDDYDILISSLGPGTTSRKLKPCSCCGG